MLIKLALESEIESSDYLPLILRLRPYYDHIPSKPGFLLPIRAAWGHAPPNALLLAMIEVELDPSEASRARLRTLFRDYFQAHYPRLPLLAHPEMERKCNSPDSRPSSDVGFAVKEWYTQILIGAEALFCDHCDHPLIPYFGRTNDLYFCSNPACDSPNQGRVRYHNHCWSCHSTIDSEYHLRCSRCGWYVCRTCGKCKQGCAETQATAPRSTGSPRPITQIAAVTTPSPRSFIDLYQHVVKTYQSPPTSRGAWVRMSLDRGRKILTSQNELDRYLFLYGGHHYYKLIDALAAARLEHIGRCTIIDWGCGQGTASHVLLDELAARSLRPPLDRMVLIEPSRVALDLAADRVRTHRNFPTGCTIITINAGLDDVDIAQAVDPASTAYLHLFSNILDIDTFSLHRLVERISQACYGRNTFLCTGPNYYGARQRTDAFCEHLRSGRVVHHESRDDRTIEADIYYVKKRKFVRDLITRYHRILDVEITDQMCERQRSAPLSRQRQPAAPRSLS
ncbi:MAG: hypothetical protein WCI67_05170 [Chloroflexales bacterium]